MNEDDLKWADIVYVMESEHKLWITTRFEEIDLPKIDVLDIPDEFDVMDPDLIEMLRSTLDPEFKHLTSNQP